MICPACDSDLVRSSVADDALDECRSCHGIWLDIESFRRLATDPGRQAALLAKLQAHEGEIAGHARALPCPRCQRPMAPYDFASASSVHIDACRAHGVWFDRDELRRIFELIRSGVLTPRRDQPGETSPARPPPRESSVAFQWLDAWDVMMLLDMLLDG